MGWQNITELGQTGDRESYHKLVAARNTADAIIRAFNAGQLRTPAAAAGAAQQLDGLADEMSVAFGPRKTQLLLRLSQRLDRDSGRARHRPRRAALPVSGWELDDDDELGFLGALASLAGPIVGGIGDLVGGLFGGKKKSAPRASSPAAPAAPVMTSNAGVTSGSNVSLPAIGGVIADQIRAVPPPVRQQVTDALRQTLDQYKSGQADAHQLIADIKTKLGPTLKAQLSSVNQAGLQRQATFEHESINRSNKRWEANAKAQTEIMNRMVGLEKKLGTAIVTKNARTAAVAKAFGIPAKLQG